jgi:hypothetical protein
LAFAKALTEKRKTLKNLSISGIDVDDECSDFTELDDLAQ